VHVFQRTPNFSAPAHNGPTDPDVVRDWLENRATYRARQREQGAAVLLIDPSLQSAHEATPEERQRVYEQRWARGGFSLLGAFSDLIIDKTANDTACAFIAERIREIVKDPEVAETLVPKAYPVGTKRMCVDTGYYATFNRDNVTLVDVSKAPIEAITEEGLRTAAQTYALDSIVCAIGFDAMTGALNRIDVRGRNGISLSEKWKGGPRTHLGLTVAGFPNLFIVTGPGSPSVLCNMVVAIEQHVDWIAACIGYLGERQLDAIEATAEAEDAWVAHVNEVAEATLFPLANSWYIGANVPGKPRVFMPYIGGFPIYRQKCDEVAAAGYEGFALSSAARP
jgi:cyclohexanone monooxygenase